MTEQNEPFCARCARFIKNCCQVPDVYVTLDDVERIVHGTGRRDFFEFRVSSDPSYVEQLDDPTWREFVIRPDGSRRVLKHTNEGNCTFLGLSGCLVDLEVRPLVCRLYPFDYTGNGIKEQPAPGCPTFLLGPEQDLFQTLGMTREDACRWHKQLYDEIRKERLEPCVLV